MSQEFRERQLVLVESATPDGSLTQGALPQKVNFAQAIPDSTDGDGDCDEGQNEGDHEGNDEDDYPLVTHPPYDACNKGQKDESRHRKPEAAKEY
jgi:hypothetical protein